jgi:hypothetical protein
MDMCGDTHSWKHGLRVVFSSEARLKVRIPRIHHNGRDLICIEQVSSAATSPLPSRDISQPSDQCRPDFITFLAVNEYQQISANLDACIVSSRSSPPPYILPGFAKAMLQRACFFVGEARPQAPSPNQNFRGKRIWVTWHQRR